jgi:hypothetical protein
MQQLHPGQFARGHAVGVQPPGRPLERAMRYVQAGDLPDARQLEQPGHQLARTAPEVQDAPRPAGRDRRRHRRDPLVVQPERALGRLLRGVLLGVGPVRVGALVGDQPGQGVPGEQPVMPEVALRDQLPVGMDREPLAAAPQQLGDLVGARPVVLVVVQHRQQDRYLLQHVLEPGGDRQRHRQVIAVAPVGELAVQGQRRRRNRVAERLEQPAEQRLAAAARQHRQADLQGDRLGGQFRPFLAPAAHGGAEQLRHGDAEKGRRRIGPVVHVAAQRELARRAGPAPDQPDRIDVEHQGRAASLR